MSRLSGKSEGCADPVLSLTNCSRLIRAAPTNIRHTRIQNLDDCGCLYVCTFKTANARDTLEQWTVLPGNGKQPLAPQASVN